MQKTNLLVIAATLALSTACDVDDAPAETDGTGVAAETDGTGFRASVCEQTLRDVRVAAQSAVVANEWERADTATDLYYLVLDFCSTQ